MLTFSVFSRKVEITFGFFFILSAATLSGGAGALPLLFCGLHELSHLFAMRIFGVKASSVRLYGAGIKIEADGLFTLKKLPQAVIYLFGPAANLLAACVFRGTVRDINLALCLFNMLPVSYFDGGRLAALLFGEGSAAAKALSAAAVAFLAFLIGYAAFTLPLELSPSSVVTFGFILLSSLLDVD